jgi:protein-disulfide isomerase
LIAIASCGSSNLSTARPRTVQAQANAAGQGTAAEVTSLLAGIPQRGRTLGHPKAAVTLQFFGDLQCPYCRRFTLLRLPSLIQGYVRQGKLKIEYRALKTATLDPEIFQLQQVAALAAGRQNKLWEFIDLFYRKQQRENSGYVTERYLGELAEQVPGLNLIAWTAARTDATLASALTSDALAASNAGLRSTPSFVISRSGSGSAYASILEKLRRG